MGCINLRVFLFRSLINLLGVMLLSGLIFLGCERSNQDKQSSFELKIAQTRSKTVSGLATQLVRVMVNVSTKEKEIACIYDENNLGFSATGPCEIKVADGNIYAKVDVPFRGIGLVQVLTAYEDSGASGDGIDFLYGADAGVDFNLPLASAEINLTAVPGGSSKMGAFVGQMFAPDGFAYTGLMEIRYKPPGQPSMVVDITEIFAGWVTHAIVFDNVQLEYVVRGVRLTPAPVDFSTFDKLVADQTALTSSHLTTYPRSNNSDGPAKMYVGYLGKGSLTKKVCVDPSISGVLTNEVCDGYNPMDLTFMADLYSSFMVVVKDSDGPQEIGFMGPFGLVLGTPGDLLKTTASGTGTTAEWRYLPGVESRLGGVRAFYSPSYSATEFQTLQLSTDRGLIKCRELYKEHIATGLPHKGYSFVAEVPWPTNKYTFPDTSTATDPHLLLCPYGKLGGSFGSALSSKDTMGGGDNSSSGPYMRLEGLDNGSNGYVSVAYNTCRQVSFRTYTSASEGSADPYFVSVGPGDLEFTVSPDSGVQFFLDGDTICDGTAVTSFTILEGADTTGVYRFMAPSPVGDININVNFTGRTDIAYDMDSEILEAL